MTKDKVAAKKTTPIATQTSPVQTDSSTPSKTLIVSNEMEYNIIEDMKKTSTNITFYELSKLKHQQKLLLKELHVVPVAPLPAVVISQQQPPFYLVLLPILNKWGLLFKK